MRGAGEVQGGGAKFTANHTVGDSAGATAATPAATAVLCARLIDRAWERGSSAARLDPHSAPPPAVVRQEVVERLCAGGTGTVKDPLHSTKRNGHFANPRRDMHSDPDSARPGPGPVRRGVVDRLALENEMATARAETEREERELSVEATRLAVERRALSHSQFCANLLQTLDAAPIRRAIAAMEADAQWNHVRECTPHCVRAHQLSLV
jgi:hypothetical protein